MKKTWFHFLPEVGRPIERQADRLIDLQSKIDGLQKEYVEMFNQLHSEVVDCWDMNEIAEAKRRYDESLERSIEYKGK